MFCKLVLQDQVRSLIRDQITSPVTCRAGSVAKISEVVCGQVHRIVLPSEFTCHPIVNKVGYPSFLEFLFRDDLADLALVDVHKDGVSLVVYCLDECDTIFPDVCFEQTLQI